MAIFQVESGVCHGRGFTGQDVNGYLAKFTSWVTKTPTSGGPQWYVIDDQSAAVTDPYIVVSDLPSHVVNQVAKIIKVGMIKTEAGYIRVQFYMYWNPITHTGQGIWSGHRLNTYDDADFSYDFRGGAECMILQTRLGTSWYTAGLDEWEGLTNLVEGTDKTGTLQTSAAAGSNVILQLGSGQAANFTLNKYYYIYDLQGHTWANYVRATNINLSADRVTVDATTVSFPTSAVMCAYAHRYVTFGNGTASYISGLQFTSHLCKLPYCSCYQEQANIIHDQVGPIYGDATMGFNTNLLITVDPDDESYYIAQRPIIIEHAKENVDSTATLGMNRSYGLLKNCFAVSLVNMAQGLDGKIISGVNYLYCQPSWALTQVYDAGIAILFRDSESSV